jgi:TPR repeat protein
MYMNGLGVARNMTKAKGYFDEAAKMNVTAALNALGYMHFRGAGVAKNVTLGEHPPTHPPTHTCIHTYIYI